MTSDFSPVIRDAAEALTTLHKHMANLAIEEARIDGAVLGPLQRMQLLTHEPEFQWLRAISKLIIEVEDVARENSEVDAALADGARTAVERVIGPGIDGEFAELRYRMSGMVTDHPDVGIALSAVRIALSRLPTAGGTEGQKGQADH